MQNGDDDFDLSKYILKLSKKIAQLTKDYVGLPFSSTSQLPFAIDARPQSKYHTITKKWQKGDPLVGMQTQSENYKKMILNLPDGTTLIDMCYPGWEISVLEEPALEHFFRKRYMFGDYYSHFLNGRPVQNYSPDKIESQEREAFELAEAAKARREDVMRRRRTTLEQAAEQQQRRGVPFDAQPLPFQEYAHQNTSTSSTTFSTSSSIISAGQSDSTSSDKRKLVHMAIGSRFDSDATTGTNDIRLVIKKTYDNGETELVQRRSQNAIEGELDENLERFLSAQHLTAFPDLAQSAETQESKGMLDNSNAA